MHSSDSHRHAGVHSRTRRARREIFRAAALLGFGVSMAFGSGAVHARDILRMGAGGAAPQGKGVAGASNTAGSAAAAQAGANAQSLLARTTQAVMAAQHLQSAAQAIAALRPNSVPNGLVVGGLQVAPGVPKDLSHPAAGENPNLWLGAKLPVQSTLAHGQTEVTIVQTSPQAVLNWQTFNIGSGTDVYFNQRGGNKNGSNDWVAINKISDPSGQPSQILGSMHGEGAVYLINTNGILFGGDSQVNLHTLVASSLPINDSLVQRGLLNNPDDQFLFSALPQKAGAKGTPAFDPVVTDPPFGVTKAAPAYTLAQGMTVGSKPTVKVAGVVLTAGTDYTTTSVAGKTQVNFTASGLAKAAGGLVSVSYDSATIRYGDVIVQAGARLSSPSTAAHVGGRIALIGPNVTNAGTISSADGQTILAAGLQVGFAAHQSSDASLRGLDVYIGAVADPLSTIPAYAGAASNSGLIQSPRADVTIAGKSVNQLGVIDSSTSVTTNGRIDLLADYGALGNPQTNTAAQAAPFLFQFTGNVTLGTGSVSQILPELESSDTAPGALPLASQVRMEGRNLHLGADSVLWAPSGNVVANAGVFHYEPGTTPVSPFVHSSGQIYLEAGATIDVAGSTSISAPISENIVSVQLRGSELANSPLQRTGTLRGQTIQVDVRQQGVFNGFAWVGTPLADASGYANLIQRPVGELTIGGGSVTLTAGGSVVMQPGSNVNVSGGFIDYQGGLVQTSRVISGGQILDISQATPDLVYDGFYTGTYTVDHSKYGIAEIYTNPLLLNGLHYEAGYRYGGAGGSVNIAAPGLALDGSLLGLTVSGSRQRSLQAPPSSLVVGTDSQSDTHPYLAATPKLPVTVIFQDGDLTPAAPFALDAAGNAKPLRKDREEQVLLSPELVTSGGFGSVTVNNPDGNVVVPAGTTLTLAPQGTLSLTGANVTVEGSISVPGGTISLAGLAVSPGVFQLSQYLPVAPAAAGCRPRSRHHRRRSFPEYFRTAGGRPAHQPGRLYPAFRHGWRHDYR